jgi:hypothetical protein
MEIPFAFLQPLICGFILANQSPPPPRQPRYAGASDALTHVDRKAPRRSSGRAGTDPSRPPPNLNQSGTARPTRMAGHRNPWKNNHLSTLSKRTRPKFEAGLRVCLSRARFHFNRLEICDA